MIDLIKKREKQAAYFESNTITKDEYIEIIDRAIAAESTLSSIAGSYPVTDEGETLAGMAREALSKVESSGVDDIINFGNSESTGPTERQVYQWFQESTITHHIEEDGHHISKRAMFVARKAWECALQSDAKSKPDSWYDVEVIDALVRRLDVVINGEKGAARQAMLCDLVAQLEVEELPKNPKLGWTHFCTKCGFTGWEQNHNGCNYLAIDLGAKNIKVEHLDSAAPQPIGFISCTWLPHLEKGNCAKTENWDMPAKLYSKAFDDVLTPVYLHSQSNHKSQRITEQDVIVKDLVALLKAERDCTWVDQDIHQAAIDAAIVKFGSHVTAGGINQKATAPEHREIPVNDPIFYFVAQHYPLTAQVVERIYRECTHHLDSSSKIARGQL